MKKELINALYMSFIHNKPQDVLAPLEEALNVVGKMKITNMQRTRCAHVEMHWVLCIGYRLGLFHHNLELRSSSFTFDNNITQKSLSFMEGRLWISDNKASLLEIETGRDASDR